MTLKYTDDDFEDFEYDVADDEVLSALGEICYDMLPDTFKSAETKSQNELLIEDFIKTFDLQKEFENDFYDNLREYFEIEAKESHRESEQRSSNYFRDTGLSQRDFIGE